MRKGAKEAALADKKRIDEASGDPRRFRYRRSQKKEKTIGPPAALSS